MTKRNRETFNESNTTPTNSDEQQSVKKPNITQIDERLDFKTTERKSSLIEENIESEYSTDEEVGAITSKIQDVSINSKIDPKLLSAKKVDSELYFKSIKADDDNHEKVTTLNSLPFSNKKPDSTVMINSLPGNLKQEQKSGTAMKISWNGSKNFNNDFNTR